MVEHFSVGLVLGTAFIRQYKSSPTSNSWFRMVSTDAYLFKSAKSTMARAPAKKANISAHAGSRGKLLHRRLFGSELTAVRDLGDGCSALGVYGVGRGGGSTMDGRSSSNKRSRCPAVLRGVEKEAKHYGTTALSLHARIGLANTAL